MRRKYDDWPIFWPISTSPRRCLPFRPTTTWLTCDSTFKRIGLISSRPNSTLRPPRPCDASTRCSCVCFAASRGAIGDRVRAGRILDGHGDLRPEHVALIDPPAVFDCLEFSAELRQIDVVDELSPWNANGSEHPPSASKCSKPIVVVPAIDRRRRLLRSTKPIVVPPCVRKSPLSARQLVGSAREEQSTLGNELFGDGRSSVGTMQVWPPPIVVCGLMGTGKTTIARALCDELGLELLRTDAIRHELLPTTGEAAAYGEGRYSSDGPGVVYEELFRRTAAMLDAGISVVVDGTFARAADRERALQVGRGGGADAVLIECRCTPEMSAERISKRLEQATPDASEARPELIAEQQAAWESSPSFAASYCVEANERRPNMSQRSSAGCRIRLRRIAARLNRRLHAKAGQSPSEIPRARAVRTRPPCSGTSFSSCTASRSGIAEMCEP